MEAAKIPSSAPSRSGNILQKITRHEATRRQQVMDDHSTTMQQDCLTTSTHNATSALHVQSESESHTVLHSEFNNTDFNNIAINKKSDTHTNNSKHINNQHLHQPINADDTAVHIHLDKPRSNQKEKSISRRLL